ncbi:META domain-containing protein [Flagellimonas meridianipacifica]|uniref:META domain-containing protein n=1 Tax=Flagellimonas meridianipacifica TaxID=1080225 RepID=A0A2T0MHN6_9FLAO|nr:META domain-containing protein [Allomuricauda pacifica]PRX57089.1 META domain-containing protein [Allomuricauda pacifica]
MINKFFYVAFALLGCTILLACNNDDSDSIENRLTGQWSIVAISISDSPIGPVIEPEDGEVISVTFMKNGEFSGNTSINSFGGRGTTNNDTLRINELVSTDALDTFFGQAFYDAMSESNNENQQASVFTMIFVDENTLNLIYNEFKFLSLERM